MYAQIKQLADEAVALQNKDRMDAALREISGMCAAAQCPDATMGEHACADRTQCFEPCGALGHDAEHAKPAPAAMQSPLAGGIQGAVSSLIKSGAMPASATLETLIAGAGTNVEIPDTGASKTVSAKPAAAKPKKGGAK